MKGLFLKDLLLLKGQYKSVLMVICCGIFMSFSLGGTVLISYLTIIGTMLSIGTIGYDEFDNGYSYIFALPASRKTYVREKYLLAVCAAAVMTLIGIGLGSVLPSGSEETFGDLLLSGGAMLMTASVFAALMLPVRIRYNSEQSRTIMYISYAVIIVIAVFGSRLLNRAGIDSSGFIASLDQVDLSLSFGIMAAAAIVLLIISEQISERLIMHKEY